MIDPGYLPARKSYYLGKEWLASPYAHNLIMVNPDCGAQFKNVDDELFFDYTSIRESLYDWNDVSESNPNNYKFNYYSFEPVGRCYYDYNEFPWPNYPGNPPPGSAAGPPTSPLQPKNPAYRNYFIHNNSMQHLQVEIDYDHAQDAELYASYNGNVYDKINIKRNFYGLNFNTGNEFFLIYDELTSSLPTNSNEFMNQLHFGVFQPGVEEDQLTPINQINSDDGIFNYTNYDGTANLHGAMGSPTIDANWTLKDNLPQGLYLGRDWGGLNPDPPAWEHKSLLINTSTSGNEKFLTILIPSENNTSPIYSAVKENGIYSVNFSEEENESVIAINNNDENSEFFDYTYPGTYEDITTDADLIYLKCFQDPVRELGQVIRFVANNASHVKLGITEIFVDEGNELEEIMVDYEDGYCSFTLYPETAEKIKIYRNDCILDSDSYSSNDFIAYDSDFYYINYDEIDLPANAHKYYHDEAYLIDSEQTVILTDFICGANVPIFVGESSSLIFMGDCKIDPSSSIIIEGEFHLIDGKIDGNFRGQPILNCQTDGSVQILNSQLINASFGVSCYGELIIEESTILNCNRGIDLYGTANLSFSSSTILVPEGGIGQGYLSIGISAIGDAEINCENSDFLNLSKAIYLFSNDNTTNEINNCSFENNDIAISNYYSKIKVLSSAFLSSSSQMGIYCEGVYTLGRHNDEAPNVFNFNKVQSCTFDGFHFGVVYKNSSPRLVLNEFGNCGFAIRGMDNSYIDCSWNCYNDLLASNNFHILFNDNNVNNFSVGFKLKNGHNNLNDPGNFDFVFIGNPSEITVSSMINCNGNYWSDQDDYPVDVFPFPFYQSSFIFDPALVDPDPLNPGQHLIVSRYDEAIEYELAGEIESALALLRIILCDQLEEEKKIWGECIDDVFILSNKLDEDLVELANFYQTLINNIPSYLTVSETTSYIKLLNDYIKKCAIKQKDYQMAANIIQERISDPVSELDVIYAEMELENIFMLNAIENGERSELRTEYDSLNPGSIKQLQINQKNYWNSINNLLGITNEQSAEFEIPSVPVLSSNYPNPFNPSTTICFSIPVEAKVNISIYNVKGQKVKVLTNELLSKGSHETIWNGRDKSNKPVSSGVYFYNLDVNGKTKSVKKCLLLK